MKQPNKLKVAAYCRVADSTDDPYAIRQQERKLHAFAKENGYTIGTVYLDNGYSDPPPKLPGFQGLMQDMEAGKVKCVLMTDYCRLPRDWSLNLAFTDLCIRNGVAVMTVEDYPRDPFEPSNALTALVADFHRRQRVGAVK